MTKFQAKRSLTLAAMLLTLLALVSFSCTPDAEPEPDGAGIKETSSFGGIAFLGEQTMAELTLRSEVIARVRFNAAEQTTEMLRYRTSTPNSFDEFYAGAVVVTFDVKEYLKGSGGAQIRAVLLDGDSIRYTEAEARAAAGDLLAFREKQYDNRDAIVFLAKGPLIPRIQEESDLYFLAYLRANGRFGYTVDSKSAKAWLPAASAQGGGGGRAVGAGGSSSDSQLFITRVSDTGGGGGGARGASGQSGAQQESLTLADLKTFINNVEAQVTAGGGTERYRECLIKKHARLSYVKLLQAQRAKSNIPWELQYPRSLASGSPAGSEVYEGGEMLIISNPDEPTWSDVAVIKSGADAALFNHTWPLKATTMRPLPAGEYRFYWAEQNELTSLCDAVPEALKTRDEIVVTVTAPEGTLHEAFFDPVTLASGVGVGADASNGVLNPASFTEDGTSTSITGLKWDNGSVVLSLSPFSSLSAHKLDFIELDGSVSLSLPESSATEDSTAGTLTWSVPDQPWHNDDLLMLRIAASSTLPTPVPTAEPTPEPTAVPTPEPTAVPTAVPTPEPTAVPTAVPTPLDRPTQLSGGTTGATGAILDWADVTGATSYRIRVRLPSGWATLPHGSVRASFNGSSATITGLPAWPRSFEFRVRAVNSDTQSRWSDILIVNRGAPK